MQFLELKIENFLSIQSEVLHLDGRGVLLISGANGAGKSSLTSKAICWALFGETVKGVKGDAVISVAHPKLPSGVEVTFLVGGKVHTVRRRRNPMSLELDGQRFRVPAETQRAIEQLVGRDLDSFMAADYFGQDRPIDFLAMTPTAQMETVEAILRLSRLDQIVAVAKEKAAQERKLIDELENLSRSRRGQIQELDRQMSSATERHRHLQSSIDIRELTRRDVDLKEAELRRSILKGPVSHAQVDRLQIEQQLREAIEQLRKHKETVGIFQARSIHLRNDVSSYRGRIREIVDEVCPTCGAPVQKELTERLQNEQKNIQAAYQRVLNEQATVSQWLAPSAGVMRSFEEAVETHERLLDEINTNLDRFENGLAGLNKRREEMAAADERDHAIMHELEGMVDSMTRQRSDLETMVALNDVGSKHAMNRLSALTYWMNIFGKTFKNMILEQALPFLQERTEYHLRLLNNPELKVHFSTQKTLKSGEERQQFTVVAFCDQGGQSEMSLSGGERQMVSFAVGLALSELADSQTGSSSNLMILDEPFTMLDERNCEEVVSYVTTELVKRKATILLISNDERMKALIPGGIHVKRGDDGYSRVV